MLASIAFSRVLLIGLEVWRILLAVVRNVIFDLGGVVLDWSPDAILDGCYTDPGDKAALKQAVFQHPDWLLMDQGLVTEAEMITRLEERTGRPTPELARLLEAVRESLRPKPATLALIERLRARGVPLYCLSNMPASTFEQLRARHDFWPAFSGIVISGEIKMVKPHPEIFHHLLNRYGLVPADTVFIDDMPANIEAAQRLGMKTIWFRHALQCESELEPLLGAG